MIDSDSVDFVVCIYHHYFYWAQSQGVADNFANRLRTSTFSGPHRVATGTDMRFNH